MRTLLSFDLGTSGVKACLYSTDGRLISARYGRYPTFYGEGDRREQIPTDWWDQIIKTVRSMKTDDGLNDIAAIGVSGHSLTAIPINREGKLLCERVPIWSDGRALHQADRFFEQIDYRKWYLETGCGFPRHLYTVFKIMWLKDHLPKVYEDTWKILGSKDYVNYLLTGTAATDRSYASGSGVYILADGSYSSDYIDAAGIDRDKLPDVFESCRVIGALSRSAASAMGISEGIPVAAGGVDNACMSLGANCKKNGDGYASLGTSAWITVSSDTPSLDFESRIYSFAHVVPGQYIPSVGIFASGAALEWARSRLFADGGGDDAYDRLSEMVTRSAVGSRGLMFVPNLAGGSSFDPSPDVRGAFVNMDMRQDENDVVRAVYEGIAMHLRFAYSFLEKSTKLGDRLLLVGGGAKSSVWRQIYAEVFGVKTVKTAVAQDAASLGAAALAAVGTGEWESFDALDRVHTDEVINEPDPANVIKYGKLMEKYKKICVLTGAVADVFSKGGMIKR